MISAVCTFPRFFETTIKHSSRPWLRKRDFTQIGQWQALQEDERRKCFENSETLKLGSIVSAYSTLQAAFRPVLSEHADKNKGRKSSTKSSRNSSTNAEVQQPSILSTWVIIPKNGIIVSLTWGGNSYFGIFQNIFLFQNKVNRTHPKIGRKFELRIQM